jgi:hypothetical protein
MSGSKGLITGGRGMTCVPRALCKGYARNELSEFLSGRIRFLLAKAARRVSAVDLHE